MKRHYTSNKTSSTHHMNFDLIPLEEGNQQEHVFIPADLNKDKDRIQG